MPIHPLSTGLRKRVGIVAGMLFDPHVIMLDEPSNAIDPITRSLLVDYVNQLRADERTLLTVTHDLEYCWNVADRIIILDDEHLVKDMMLAEFDDYEAFTKASTLGRDRTHVDFGLPARGRQALDHGVATVSRLSNKASTENAGWPPRR